MKIRTENDKAFDNGFYYGCVATLIASTVIWLIVIVIIEYLKLF